MFCLPAPPNHHLQTSAVAPRFWEGGADGDDAQDHTWRPIPIRSSCVVGCLPPRPASVCLLLRPASVCLPAQRATAARSLPPTHRAACPKRAAWSKDLSFHPVDYRIRRPDYRYSSGNNAIAGKDLRTPIGRVKLQETPGKTGLSVDFGLVLGAGSRQFESGRPDL